LLTRGGGLVDITSSSGTMRAVDSVLVADADMRDPVLDARSPDDGGDQHGEKAGAGAEDPPTRLR
jgi:hypothetical protein